MAETYAAATASHHEDLCWNGLSEIIFAYSSKTLSKRKGGFICSVVNVHQNTVIQLHSNLDTEYGQCIQPAKIDVSV